MRKYKVDGWNNFCRIFEVPEKYPSGFCTNGGKPVNFQMVDWFNPVPDMPQAAISKEDWIAKGMSIDEVEIDLAELEEVLIPFIRQKQYAKPCRQYLIIYSFGATTLVDAT